MHARLFLPAIFCSAIAPGHPHLCYTGQQTIIVVYAIGFGSEKYDVRIIR